MARAKALPSPGGRPVLARPGDPLVLSSGLEVPDPKVERARKKSEAPARGTRAIPPHEYRPTKQRGIRDLQAPATTMNAVGVIFMYTMLGLSDREICELCKLVPEDVQELRLHEAYGDLFDTVLNEFISADSELIQSRIAAYAHRAIGRVSEIVESEDEHVALRASQDILDRAGHSAKGAEARKGITTDDLRIVVSDGDRKVEVAINPKE